MDININNDLQKILGDDKINVIISDPEFDIPIYIGKNNQDKKFKKILVLNGGGIKGIAHVGAFQALEELGYLDKFEVFAGTSVGALLLGLLVVGYKPTDMYEFIIKFNLDSMKSINFLNVLDNFGLDTGVKIEYVIKRLIEAKGFDQNITLSDLYDKTNKKVVFTTVCLNTVSVEYISHTNYPTLPLYKAIRMSLSIPWIYTPVEHNNNLYVDGGCIDNYPIGLFKNELSDVLGVYLTEINDTVDKIDNIEMFTFRVFQCFMEGVNTNSKKGYEDCTVTVNMKPISLIDYGLDRVQKDNMFKIGYNSVMDYFKKNN
jgi:NTE family protein